MTCSRRSGLSRVSMSRPGWCWLEMSTVLSRTGTAVLVLERDLGLAVGPQVGQHARLAHLGQPLGQPVGQPDRQGHEVVGLVAGEAEHHPLVAGALGADLVLAAGAPAHLVGGGDALADVGRLLVDGGDDPARVAVEAVRLPVVADGADRLAHDLGDVDVGPGGDLAGDDDQPGGEQRLARHPPGGVLGEDGVEDGVGDLVGHLVGMTFGDRLRGERVIAAHGGCRLVSPAGRHPGGGRRTSSTARATSRLEVRATSVSVNPLVRRPR